MSEQIGDTRFRLCVGGAIEIVGNYLEWYSEGDDDLADCPILNWGHCVFEQIDEDSIMLIPNDRGWYIEELDGCGNVTDRIDNEDVVLFDE